MDFEFKVLDKKVDERGMFYEILRSEDVNAPFGQMFLTSAAKGKVKGNHFHKRKKEWFCVVQGKITIHLLDVDSGEREDVDMDSGSPSIIRIGQGISHAISNKGDCDALIVGYISESFNPDDPDTFSHEVISL